MIPYERKTRYTIDDLAEIIKLLRSENGCPWDKVQTHESIRSELIEETYEVIEAIDRKDPALLREELGDLLLQVVFHAQIEQEQQTFTLDDVCTDICEKMLIRHPHVFSTVQADTTEEVLKNWDTIKEKTKHQTTRIETLEAVAKTLPALMRAQKVYKRASKENLAFLQTDAMLSHITESVHTLELALHMDNTPQAAEALGSILFCCTGIAQQNDIQAEQTLTDTINAFIHCFGTAESLCQKSQQPLAALTEDEWNALLANCNQTEGEETCDSTNI